jgi:hypothetical protein
MMAPKIPEKIEIDTSNEKGYDWKAPAMMKIVETLAGHGYTDEEIATLLGVRPKTLNAQLRCVPQLQEKLVKGRSDATQVMVASMFATAVGGRIYTTKKTRISPTGQVSFEITEKEEPAQPVLQMFWLTNEDPENWRQFRNVIRMNKDMERHDDTLLESDKITRLAAKILEDDSDRRDGKHSLSKQAAYASRRGAFDAGDVQAHVSGESTDNLQDDVLDVPTETGTE